MFDSDPSPAAPGGAGATAGRVDAARRHLVMLRSLHEEVLRTAPTLCPQGMGTWRSAAADRYLENLDDLRSRLVGSALLLGQAEAALDARVRVLQAQLDAELAAQAAR